MAIISQLKTKESMKKIIRKNIIDMLREILSDAEYGLKLKTSFVKKLNKSIISKGKGDTVDFDKVLRKYQI